MIYANKNVFYQVLPTALSFKIVTADAMSIQKDIIERIRKKGGDSLIELKANQRSLRYGVEDRLKELALLYSYTEGPELGHGRIETRTYNIYDSLEIIADKKKGFAELMRHISKSFTLLIRFLAQK